MHYCFEPVRIREAVQERRNSARAGIDIFGVAVGVLAAIVLLPCMLLAEQSIRSGRPSNVQHSKADDMRNRDAARHGRA